MKADPYLAVVHKRLKDGVEELVVNQIKLRGKVNQDGQHVFHNGIAVNRPVAEQSKGMRKTNGHLRVQ